MQQPARAGGEQRLRYFPPVAGEAAQAGREWRVETG